MATIDTGNYMLSGADLFWAATPGLELVASSGFRTSSRSLGNIISPSITPEITFVDHWVSSKGKRVKDKTVANTSSITISFTFDEINQDNLARFFVGDQSASEISVLTDTLAEGCGQLVIETDIGKDLVYQIPKGTLRPDGALEFSGEDWSTGGMQLEVLQLTETDCENATVWSEFSSAKFGKISTKTLS